MAIHRTEIERTLDELISYEGGMKFQGLAVVLAKAKWPEFIASEWKADLGLDAYVPPSLAPDGKGKGLVCSLTPTIGKIKKDAKKIKKNFQNVRVLIFFTPHKITNYKASGWAKEIWKAFGYELVVVSREDIITELMIPANAPICLAQLEIPVQVEAATERPLDQARQAVKEEVQAWLSRPQIKGKPLICLRARRLGSQGEYTEEVLNLETLRASLLEGRRIVLESPAGRGKTTTLIQTASQLAERGRLAFLIDLPAWARSKQNILEFIAGMRTFRSRGVTPESLAKLYLVEHYSFLLNGWNEISEEYSEDAVRSLREVERSFPAAGIIVATRTHYIRPPLPGAFRLKLLELSRDQRNEYLNELLGIRAQDLVLRLEGDRLLEHLTRTPLILAEVAKLFEEGHPIPETKLGVLRAVTRMVEDSDEHRDCLQRPPLTGRAGDYLSSLAFDMMARGDVMITEERVREIVSSASEDLRGRGQIAILPEPASVLNTLCEHHVLERLEYPSVSFRFQHQQLQEFYASSRLMHRLSELNVEGDSDMGRRIQIEFLNKPMWEEPLRMIAEAIGAGDTELASDGNMTAVANWLVELSITIDPIFAGELSRLFQPVLAENTRRALGTRLRFWFRVNDNCHRRCALAGMLATGSPDFRDIVLPLLTNTEQQVRLETYRALGRFFVSSLGSDWKDIVEGWTAERRIEFIQEVGLLAPTEAAEICESLAVADPSEKVKIEAVRTLEWLGAETAAMRLLDSLSDESFAEVLKLDSLTEVLSSSLRLRALTAYRRLIGELTDVNDRFSIMLRAARLGDENAPEDLKGQLSSMPPGRLDDLSEHLVRSALELIRRREPDWVNRWITLRIVDGTLWREHWKELITSVPEDLASDLGSKIITEVLQPSEAQRVIGVLSVTNNASIIAKVFFKMCALRKTTLNCTREQAAPHWQLYRQLQDLFQVLPAPVIATGVSTCLGKAIELAEFLVILDLFAQIDPNSLNLADQLSPEHRQVLSNYLKNGVEFALRQDDFSGDIKMRLALALATVGAPSDIADLRRLINSDIERVRKGREALLGGDHGPMAQGAKMICSNWYVVALSRLDPANADKMLLELLDEPEYEADAASSLVRLARKPSSLTQFRVWVPDFSEVWEARDGRRLSKFEEERRLRYTKAIRNRISALFDERRTVSQPDSFNSRIKALAKILASLDGLDSVGLVLDAMALPGRWDGWTQVEAIEAMLRNGASLQADAVLKILTPTIEKLLAEGLHDQGTSYLMKRCLCLLLFTDLPSKCVDTIRNVLSRPEFPNYELRDIVTALGQSRSGEALEFLLELATNERIIQAYGREWIKAIASLGLDEANKVLLSFVDPDLIQHCPKIRLDNQGRELLASCIADFARANPNVKERIFQLCGIELSNWNRILLSAVIATLGTPDAIMAGLRLIRDDAQPPIPWELTRGIENILVERSPYGEVGHAHTLEPRSCNALRRNLFEMVLADESRRKAAFALLGEMEVWRLDYGKPTGEPRHPYFESAQPWPPLEVMKIPVSTAT